MRFRAASKTLHMCFCGAATRERKALFLQKNKFRYPEILAGPSTLRARAQKLPEFVIETPRSG